MQIDFFQIGSLCMDVIDYELKRFDAMQKDLENKRDSVESEHSKTGIKPKDQSKSVDDLDTLMDEERPKEVWLASSTIHFSIIA